MRSAGALDTYIKFSMTTMQECLQFSHIFNMYRTTAWMLVTVCFSLRVNCCPKPSPGPCFHTGEAPTGSSGAAVSIAESYEIYSGPSAVNPITIGTPEQCQAKCQVCNNTICVTCERQELWCIFTGWGELRAVHSCRSTCDQLYPRRIHMYSNDWSWVGHPPSRVAAFQWW